MRIPAVFWKRVGRVRVRCAKCRPVAIPQPVTAVSRVCTGIRSKKYLLFFTILFIIFTILFTTLFTTWGEKSTTIQHFIGFWSAHRPFVSVCLARSTLELSLFRCHTLVVTHSRCRHYTLTVT